MPLIVSDASPLNYLVLIEAVEILPSLFASITIPAAVKEELSHPNAPSAVKSWIASPPFWLRIVSLKSPVIPSRSGPLQKADPTTTWDFRHDITDKCRRDWPQDQSNGFGEYRTSKDSMRYARHGLLEPPTALPQERLV